MHSFLSRANAISAYSLSVLAVLTFSCFISTFFHKYQSDTDIKTSRIIVKSITGFGEERKTNDLGHVIIDLQADLEPLFNWNVKQLFVYLYVEYETPSNAINQVVLWDKIIKRGENAKLDYKNLNAKYYFWDDGVGLRGNNITMFLAWNVIPNAGCLPHIKGNRQHVFTFPNQYTTSKH